MKPFWSKLIVACIIAVAGCDGKRFAWHWPTWSHRNPVAADNRKDADAAPGKTTASSEPKNESFPSSDDPRPQAEAAPDARRRQTNTEQALPRSIEDLRKGKVIPADVVMINDDPLTVEDILEPILPYLRNIADKQDAETFARTRFNQVRSAIMNQRDTLLLYQEYGQRVTEQEAEQYKKFADADIKKRITNEFGGRQARYEKYLQSLGLSLEKVLEKRKRQLVVLKNLQDSFRPLVRPPRRKELKVFYQQNLSKFHRPPRVEFYAIEAAFADFRDAAKGLTGEEARQATRAAARKHLQIAQGELASGLPFGVVAKQYSSGIFRLKDGYWGTISAPVPIERLRKASQVALRLESGQVSDIIEGPEAFYLVRAGKRIEGKTVSFEEIQPELTRQFEATQYDRLVLGKKIELRKKAKISDQGLEGLMLKTMKRLDTLLAPDAADAR